ncbi:MAG TPA: hypothetical protein VL049_12770 [Candidatus Dormibacteraeota bacterium]|nr:hypothetical protein [Candidatus Dormibacteraeota bacterium]
MVWRSHRPATARAGAALLALVALGCSSRATGPTLHEALQREAPASMPLRDVVSDDGQVHLQVEAAGQPHIARTADTNASGAASYEIDVPIGTETPIRCWLTARPVAIGSTLAELASSKLFADTSQQEISGIDASVVGERPYLLIDVMGLAKQDGDDAFYQGKLFAAPVGVGALRCVHVGVGYRSTVQRVLSGLLASLTFAPVADSEQPAYLEVYLARVGPMNCGFGDLRAYRQDDGGWLSLQRTVVIGPRSRNEVVGLDQVRLTVADAAGRITSASADSIRGGETLHSLELTRAADGSYAVAGEVGGKALDGTLRAVEPLRDDLAIARLIAKRPGGGTLSMPKWEPEVAPLEPVEATMRCLPRNDDAEQRCEMSVGQATVQATLDAAGMPRRASIPTGGVVVDVERAVSRGSF